MSDPVRKSPGERLVERLDRRNRRRPRIGLSPAFYARFGLTDPWVDTSVDADSGAVDDAFTYVSGAGWRQHMRKLALSRWWRERRYATFSSRMSGQRTMERREPPKGPTGGLLGMGFGPSLSLSDLVFPQPERARPDAVDEEEAGPRVSPWLSGPLHSTTGTAANAWHQSPWSPARVARPLDTVAQRLALTSAANDPVQRAVAAATPASGLGSRRARSLARTVYEDVDAPAERTVRIRRVLRRAAPTVRTIIEDALPARGARPLEVARNRMGGTARSATSRRGLQTAWYGRTASTRALEQSAAQPPAARKPRRRVPAASPTRRTQRPPRISASRVGTARPTPRLAAASSGDEAPSGPPEPAQPRTWRGASRAVARAIAADPVSDEPTSATGAFPALSRSRRPRSPGFNNLSDAALAERLAPWSDAPDVGSRPSSSLWAASRDAAGSPWMDRAVGADTPPSARPVGRGTGTGPRRLPHWRPTLGASDLVLPDALADEVQQVQAQRAPPVSPWANSPFTAARTVRGALSVVEQRSALASRLAASSFTGARLAAASAASFQGAATAGQGGRGFTGAQRAQSPGGAFQGAATAGQGTGGFTGAQRARATGGAFQGAATAGGAASDFRGASTAASGSGSFRGAGTASRAGGGFTGARAGQAAPGSYQGASVSRALARAFAGAAVARQAAGGFSGAALGRAEGRPWSGASAVRTGSSAFAGAGTSRAASGAFQGAVMRRSGARPWSGASTAAAAAGTFAGAGAFQTAAGDFSGSGLGSARAFPWSGASTAAAAAGTFAGAGAFQTTAGDFSGSSVGSARAFPWAGASTSEVRQRALEVEARTGRGETRRSWSVASAGTLPSLPTAADTPSVAAEPETGPQASAWSQTPYTPARVVRMVAAAAARDQGGPAVGDVAVRASERMAAVTSALATGAGSASPVPRWSPRSPSQTLAQPFAGAAASTTPAGDFQGAGTGSARDRAWRGAALGSSAGGRFSGAATRRTGTGTWSGAGAWRTPEWDWLGAGASTTPRGDFTGAALGAGFDPGFTGAALGSSLAREFSGARLGDADVRRFSGARTADAVDGTFAGARAGRTPGGTFHGTRRAWTAADGTVVRSSTPARAGFRETLDGVSAEHAGMGAPNWAVRATGRTFLNTTGDLVQGLAEARDPLEVIQVILDRGDRLAVSRNLPTPVVEVIRQIRATAAQELISPRLAAQRAADAHHSPSSSVIRGRRARSLPSTTRVVRGSSSGSAPSMTGIGATGGGKLKQLASRLQNLIRLVQVENKLSDAQRQVRMAAEGAEAGGPAEEGQSGGARGDAKAGDLEALKQEVLTTVSRELELRRERGQEDSDGHWW